LVYDTNPKFGNNYYRLRIEEVGKMFYSNIISVSWGFGTSISAYPNPANDKFMLEITSFEAATIQTKLYNSLGQIAAESNNIFAEKETRKQEFDVKNLAKGVYILEVNSGKNKEVIKIVIQ
jgi:hypothetical protein